MKTNFSLFICCLFALFTACSKSEIIENWAQFRGPNTQGISSATNLPVTWSVEENIAWKTDLSGEGHSSPIVWNNHVFLTTATEEGENCHVIALDRKTGKILWDKIVFTQQANQHRHGMNSYATATPVTDGKTVFAVFSGGGFAALDFDGNIKWTNNDFKFYSHHAMGASPILYNDLLIFPFDHSNSEEPKSLGWQTPWDQGFVLALDKNTGKERWRAMREKSCLAHATPAIMNVNGKDQIISPAGDVIQGFSTTGKLLWTVESQGEPCVPSPVIGDGLIYSAPTGAAPTRAVRPDAQGNAEIVWEQTGFTPMMASFLYVKPVLYTFPDNRICAVNAETGELLWQTRLGIGQLNPSPIYADGKIYVLSERGTTAVLKPSDDSTTPAEVIATNDLDELTRASMVVAGNQLLIRTETGLWCIGK
jgi:outer membrane protein assembly factor BamB